jgi:hypothetical protein
LGFGLGMFYWLWPLMFYWLWPLHVLLALAPICIVFIIQITLLIITTHGKVKQKINNYFEFRSGNLLKNNFFTQKKRLRQRSSTKKQFFHKKKAPAATFQH